MSGSPEDSSFEDDVSDTSTLIYGQESFDEYVPRVKSLLETLHPQVYPDEIDVERLKGGGENRIIGYSFHDDRGQRQEYILRVPRFDDGRFTNSLASLLFLRDNTDLPVPQVLTFDRTNSNSIVSPYMIQRRIRGASLLELYPKLLHQERLLVASQLGHFIRLLTSVHSPHVGQLNAEIIDMRSQPNYMLEPLNETGEHESKPYINDAATKPISELLINILLYRKIDSKRKGPTHEWRCEDWDKYIVMVKELEDLGYLEDVSVTFCHMDFEPRNILADATASPREISAFMDWDSAVFAPSFMACLPPQWLWAWQDDDVEDERHANDAPDDPEDRELKAVFEEAAGPIYARFAYEPAYRLARRLVQRIFYGLTYSQDINDAEDMLLEWAKYRDEKTKEVRK